MSKIVKRLNTEIPDPVYESMIRVFIKLALKKHNKKRDNNLSSRPPKKQRLISM